jgi:hypothetical protein
MSNRIADKAIQIMIEEVYEHETSMKGWDSSFIESIYDQYHKLGGITDAQLKVVERKYDRLKNQYGEKTFRD